MKNKALFAVLLIAMACSSPKSKESVEEDNFPQVRQTSAWLTIDGLANESDWEKAEWWNIDQQWLGAETTPEDYSGRFKMLWKDSLLYILAEIKDDTLMDIHPDGLEKYWDDDCLEIFLDENASGGNHQYNHNAFAYHIGLDYKVADIGTDSLPGYYDHVKTVRTQNGNVSAWELAITVYNDTYQDFTEINEIVKLNAGKLIGLAAAYCDNDKSAERESFFGSMPIEGEDKNRAWIDASLFGKYKLVE